MFNSSCCVVAMIFRAKLCLHSIPLSVHIWSIRPSEAISMKLNLEALTKHDAFSISHSNGSRAPNTIHNLPLSSLRLMCVSGREFQWVDVCMGKQVNPCRGAQPYTLCAPVIQNCCGWMCIVHALLSLCCGVVAWGWVSVMRSVCIGVYIYRHEFLCIYKHCIHMSCLLPSDQHAKLKNTRHTVVLYT